MKFCKDCWNFSRCNAVGRTVDFAVDDGVCCEFDEVKNMTNADRIRAMTDEELADLLMNEIWKCDKYAVCKECPRYIGECCLPIDEWLQQPAEGG